MKKMMMKGLFNRLMAAGYDPLTAGELASANYPTRKHSPKKPPKVSTREVNQITEAFLDHGTISRDGAWMQIWGESFEDYFAEEREAMERLQERSD